MKEAALESLLRTELTRRGGVAFKLDALSRKGAPDRIVTANGRTIYVELKTERGVVAPLQQFEHERIRAAGGEVVVLRGADAIRRFVDGL
jgi:hypothetical protein